MAYEGSTRRQRLPPNWPRLRKAVLQRCGGRCEHPLPNGTRCPQRATDVDHINAGDNHTLDNLQGLCRKHHAAKTSQEGLAAQAARREQLRRPPERHPGLLD